MPIIIGLYASILALAVWQENHGRDSEEGREQHSRCCS
jgi:hypothetical protein